MTRVKLTITESNCRCGYHKKGDTFVVGDICPPLCHELWNIIYPSVMAIQGKDVSMPNALMKEEYAYMVKSSPNSSRYENRIPLTIKHE